MQRAIDLQLHHVVDHPKVGEWLTYHRNCSTLHRYQDNNFWGFFMQKFNMATKKWQENNFWQNIADDSVYTLRSKNFIEMAVSCTVSEINAFLHFTQKFNMAVKNGRKTIFRKKLQITLHIPCGSKISSYVRYMSFCIFHHCKIQKIAITHLAIVKQVPSCRYRESS